MTTKDEWQGMYWDIMILIQKGLNPQSPALSPRDIIVAIVYLVVKGIYNHHSK